jgi:Kef-type K+ transport system membrane component KefB
LNPLLGVLLLVLLGLFGSRLSFTMRRGPLGPRLVVATGTHFLFLGFLLGSGVLGLLSRDLISRLYPFLALGLGWIGFLFGLQLDRRQLARFPVGYSVLAAGQAAVAFLLFLAVGAAVFRGLDVWTPDVRLALLTAAATACVSTPAGIALIRHNFLVRGRLSRLLLFIASLDAVVGIVALQLTYVSFRGPSLSPVGAWAVLGWTAVALALGAALGVVFLWLTLPRPGRDELIVFLLGLLVFGAGAALRLGVSPLFVCMVAGAVVGNMSALRRRVFAALEAWEKPIYVVLLILAGALLQFPTWLIVPLSLLYLLVRGVAKVAGGFLTPRLIGVAAPLRLGAGLLPQGGISLAMVISATLMYGTLESEGSIRLVFSTVVLGVALSELLGPLLTRDLLRRAGEIHPRVEAALAQGRAPSTAEALGRPEGVAAGVRRRLAEVRRRARSEASEPRRRPRHRDGDDHD